MPSLAKSVHDMNATLPSREGTRIIQFREALREAMSEEMRRDARIFLMGEEVAQYNGAYKISQGMLDEFGPKRIIDTPISESGFAGLAVGAAMYGLRPIVEFMSWSFSLVAADPILNNVPKMLYMSGGQWGCPIVFRGNDGAGGQLGSTHSWCVEGLYSNVPGVKIVIPSNPYDAKGLLKTAIRDDDPVFFLESERMLGDKAHVPEEEYCIPFGRAALLREGDACTVVSFGRPVNFCLEAADELASQGIAVDVLDMRTIRPLDIDSVLASLRKTNRIVVVDQCWPFASVASEVITQVIERGFDWLDTAPIRVNTADVPTPYAKNLEYAYLPNKEKIVAGVKKSLGV
ncbi:MAG: pyruvate dehydrogenase complex E1 component subunit beta [Phycisphaeraceae bacterium]|nr:pyruvate dehydrogenase complex E1 component subunit beta [Phycisphaerae bacterium]MBX3393065.1 pyruvate dehydrogenase complex E1 component subunit beta [Phycisphaeraceae bacterium]HRJ50109.1 pyruvate dehydrogenase complex E1 component subunit beta [Phycisphaerales bacterium]